MRITVKIFKSKTGQQLNNINFYWSKTITSRLCFVKNLGPVSDEGVNSLSRRRGQNKNCRGKMRNSWVMEFWLGRAKVGGAKPRRSPPFPETSLILESWEKCLKQKRIKLRISFMWSRRLRWSFFSVHPRSWIRYCLLISSARVHLYSLRVSLCCFFSTNFFQYLLFSFTRLNLQEYYRKFWKLLRNINICQDSDHICAFIR